jgi:hypothetical protein
MNGSPPLKIKDVSLDAEYALTLIRIVSRRLKLIDEEVTALGTALAQGRLPPNIALNLVEQIAPGCIAAVHLSLFEGAAPAQLHSDQGNGQ